MRLLATGVGALALLLVLSGNVMASLIGLDLSPTQGPYDGGVIEVPPGDVETLYFHIEDGTNTGLYALNDWPIIEFDIDPSGPEPPSSGEVLGWDPGVAPNIHYTASTWYPLGTIKVDGPPCTFFNITVTMHFSPPNAPLTSNAVIKHIIPEPGSACMLFTGLIGIGVLLLRRHRR